MGLLLSKIWDKLFSKGNYKIIIIGLVKFRVIFVKIGPEFKTHRELQHFWNARAKILVIS